MMSDESDFNEIYIGKIKCHNLLKKKKKKSSCVFQSNAYF